jgi:hypothetical protein
MTTRKPGYRPSRDDTLATAARVLGVPADQVHQGHVLWARSSPEWPADFPPAPQLLDCVDPRRAARVKRLEWVTESTTEGRGMHSTSPLAG